MHQMYMADQFLLVEKQLRAAAELAARAAGGDYEHTTPHRTVCHILGITAYTEELMADLKREIEQGDL